MSEQLRFRDETSEDFDAVANIVTAAFGQQHEANIVAHVRDSDDCVLSMVAQRESEVIAHVLFSRVRIETLPEVRACALGPVAVTPTQQGHGVGTALINAALERLQKTDFELEFVLGNPQYYARFGFENAARLGYHYHSRDFDRAFGVRANVGSVAAAVDAWVRYHDAFDG